MGKDLSRPWVLGIASSHNGAVCLLHGDEIIVAIQEERLLRTKRARHPGARSSLAIRYCLESAGIGPADLSLIALAASSFNDIPREQLALNPALQPSRYGVQTMVVGHHLAHAVGVFATSGFADAAVLIVDGSGSPWCDLTSADRHVVNATQASRYVAQGRGPLCETISMYMAHGTTIQPIEKQVSSRDWRPKSGMPRFSSLGTMYESVAMQIFGKGVDAAGKVMGLAPYGSPVTPARDLYTITDGQIEFLDAVPERYLHDERWPLRCAEYQNLAASFQTALEDALFVLVLRLRRLTGATRLCYAGGVALNSVANELIIENGGFDEVFIMPAAEDSGTAIGAAYFGLWQLTGRNTCRRLLHDAVGRRYSRADVNSAIERCPAIHVVESNDVIDRAVDLLCEGKILGWFHGRSELGPRALGQRSIVCDPRRPGMKDLLNRTVKFREAFRPFAPVIPVDALPAYFDTSHRVDSPFMLRVLPFRDEVRALVPAVVHVDGTGRVQTVTPEANSRFYDLVNRFRQRTGCPILLNTSLNIAGEPIVETADDALVCLLFTGLDSCVIEDVIVTKDHSLRSPLDLVFSLAIDRVAFDYRVASGWSMNGPDGRIRFFQSAHLDRLVDLEQRIAEFEQHLLQIVTQTRWGPVVHIASTDVFEVLTRIDGRRNGWAILAAMREALGNPIDETGLTSMLATLKRASIISW